MNISDQIRRLFNMLLPGNRREVAGERDIGAKMTPLLSALSRLYIGDGVLVGDSYVERVGRNVYAVNGRRVGGRNTHARTAAYLAVQALGYEVKALCSRCGFNERMEGKSHCRQCRNSISAAAMRKHRLEMSQ